MSKKRIALFSLVGLVVLGVIVAVANSGSDSGPSQSDSPPEPIAVLTATELYAEREANATRFDDQYKDQWVQVSGTVTLIDNNKVTLSTGMLLEEVVLNDLPRDAQASANRGQRFEAVCRVGNFILFTMNMEDCRLP